MVFHRRYTIFISAIAIVILILVYLPLGVNARKADYKIVEIGNDRPVDFGSDGIYDALAVDVTFFVSSGGEYGIYGILSNSGGIKGQFLGTFPEGTNNITIYFLAEDIYTKNLEGRFKIMFYLTKDGNIVDKAEYITKEYSSEVFNPYGQLGHEIEKVEIYFSGGGVVIEGNKMTVVVMTHSPIIKYYFTTDKGEGAMLTVRYLEAVAYRDINSNGIYDGGKETIARFDFERINWSLSMNLVEGYERFDFSISGSYTSNGMGIEVIFHYSSAARTIDHWGRQKFDIDIYTAGIDTNPYNIALVHEVTAKGDGELSSLYNADNEWVIEYRKGNEAIGSYSFLCTAQVYEGRRMNIGAMETRDINVSGYVLEKSVTRALLVADYHNISDDTTIHHDPTVGLNLEFVIDVVEMSVEFIKHRPEVLIGSMALTAILVILNFKLYKKRRVV